MSILKILSNLAIKSEKIHPVLGTIAVKNNMATATDMDVQISCPTVDVADGLHSPHGFDESHLRKRINKDISDFPLFDNQGNVFGSLSIKTEALQFVSLTQAKEDARFYLNGVCVVGNRMVATDGHRMNVAALADPAPNHENFHAGFIIPRSAVLLVLQAAKVTKRAGFNINFRPKSAQIVVGDIEIVSRYIEGYYPDIDTHVLIENPLKTRFMASEIKKILPTLKLLHKQNVADKHKPIALRFTNKASLMGGTAIYMGQDFPVYARFDEPMTFNPLYMADCCDGVLSYGGKGQIIANEKVPAPIVITDEARGFTSILSPMRG